MIGGSASARTAVRAALSVRHRLGIDRSAPVCVFDLAERLGVEVKFRDEKSLDGMYFKLDPPVILVSAHRPPGRQAFTCAHEIGHHELGHGTRVDRYVSDSHYDHDCDEQTANVFAANLLMPAAAVRRAFESRGWSASQCDPLQVYTVAAYLGVGYETLITQMRASLGLLAERRAKVLLKTTPKQVRRSVVGDDRCRYLVVADRAWDGGAIAIDVSATDLIVLPTSVELEGTSIQIDSEIALGTLAVARRPGITRVQTTDGDWSVFVRVSRRTNDQCTYVGRSVFRHDEDPDVE